MSLENIFALAVSTAIVVMVLLLILMLSSVEDHYRFDKEADNVLAQHPWPLSEKTGLAWLPRGYVWRVKKWSGSYRYQVVLYRKIGPFKFQLGDAYALFDDRATLPENSLLAVSRKINIQRAKFKSIEKDIVGWYPPKKWSA